MLNTVGISTPKGHSIQYLHPVQGTGFILFSSSITLSIILCSFSVIGLKLVNVFILSLSCSMLDMPLNTIATLGKDDTHLIAQEAMVLGEYSFMCFSTLGVNVDRNPPLTGSITKQG